MSEQVNFVIEQYDNKTLAEANEQFALIIVQLKAENDKLRSFAQRLYTYAMDEYPDGTELNFADEARELGVCE